MYWRPSLAKTKVFLILAAFFLASVAQSQGVDRDNKPVAPEAAPTPDQAVERFTLNLTRAATLGAAEKAPFVGRVQDQIRLVTVLSQKGTQVVYLVGPAGSGKTALVEAVAAEVKGVEILQLDLAALEAGTPFKNEFETRVKALMTKIIDSKGQYILFIDEFHSVMKIEGMADMLKPPMARGQISVIAATTADEYREFVEKDAAMTSRGQKIQIEPMSKDEALQMLRARKAGLTQKYGVTILDSTLKQAVELAARFYGADPLSRKALQIVDETMSRLSTQHKYGTQTQRVLEDQARAVENERASLAADLEYLKDAEKETAQKRIEALKTEAATISRDLAIEKKGGTPASVKLDLARREMFLKEQQITELESGTNATDRKIQQQINSLRVEVKILRGQTLPKLRAEWEKEAQERGKGRPISVDDVRLTVSADRRIPMDGIGSSAESRVGRLREAWRRTVFGQDHVIEAISRKVLSRETGIEPNLDKPLVLQLNGATGTGKTEGAKVMAEGLLYDSTSFIRFDMAQYAEKAALWTLLGSGRGYVDSDKGGVLTEAVRQRPFAVVLLDEFEKAHPDIDKALLKVFDEGRIVDTYGRPVDFRNVIFVLTTNLTAQWVFDRAVLSVPEIEERYGFRSGALANLDAANIDREVSTKLLQQRFTKEFLARIDLKINYNPIDVTMARELSAKEFRRQADALLDRKGIKLAVSEAAITALAEMVVNSPEGGREAASSRRNVITENLLLDAFNPANDIKRGQEIKIDFEARANNSGGKFTLSRGGQTLNQLDVIFPVRMGPGASNQGPSTGRTELEKAMERASGTSGAAKSGIVDANGEPIRNTESTRARGR